MISELFLLISYINSIPPVLFPVQRSDTGTSTDSKPVSLLPASSFPTEYVSGGGGTVAGSGTVSGTGAVAVAGTGTGSGVGAGAGTGTGTGTEAIAVVVAETEAEVEAGVGDVTNPLKRESSSLNSVVVTPHSISQEDVQTTGTSQKIARNKGDNNERVHYKVIHYKSFSQFFFNSNISGRDVLMNYIAILSFLLFEFDIN